MDKIKQKWINSTGKQKLVFFLWLLTFSLLLVFVISVATITKDTNYLVKHNEANPDKPSANKFIVVAKNKPSDTDHRIAYDKGDLKKPVYATNFSEITDNDAIKIYENLKDVKVKSPEKLFVGIKGIYESKEVKKNPAYANTLAATGLTFSLALIGSLVTTVIFAYNKRKGVNNG